MLLQLLLLQEVEAHCSASKDLNLKSRRYLELVDYCLLLGCLIKRQPTPKEAHHHSSKQTLWVPRTARALYCTVLRCSLYVLAELLDF